MSHPSGLAEIRFGKQGISIYGTVQQLSKDAVTVRLQTVPTDLALLQPATQTELIMIRDGAPFATEAKILSRTNCDLALRFTEKVQQVQQRKNWRFECDIAASCRAMHSDGCYGAWRSGILSDLSVGGLCLVVEASAKTPNKLEVLFTLPTRITRSRGQGEQGEPTSYVDEERPIRATLRVVHRRPRADGRIALGTAIAMIGPYERSRIARFLNEMAAELSW